MKVVGFIFSLFFLLSCYERPDYLNNQIHQKDSIFLGHYLLNFLDQPPELIIVDVTKDPPEVSVRDFDYKIFKIKKFENRYVGVLDSINKKFVLISRNDKKLDVTEFELKGAYTDFSFDPDGKIIVLYYRAGVGSGSTELLKNSGEFSIIYTNKDPGENNPLVRVVDLKNLAPSSIFFSEPYKIGGHKIELLGIVSPSRITFLNLAKLDDNEISVPLVPNEIDAEITPRNFEFILSNSNDFLDLFFTGDSSKDIYQLRFSVNEDGLGNKNPDFFPVLSQFTTGSVPSAIYPFYDNDNQLRVIVLNPTKKELNVLFPESGNIISFKTSYPYFKLLPLIKQDGSINFMLYASGYSKIAIFDLAKADVKSSNTFTTKKLEVPVEKIEKVPGVNKFVIFYKNSIGLFDGETGKTFRYTDTGTIRMYKFVGETLYFLTRYSSHTIFAFLDIEKGEGDQKVLTRTFGYQKFEIFDDIQKVFIYSPGEHYYHNFSTLGVLTYFDYTKKDSEEHIFFGFNLGLNL